MSAETEDRPESHEELVQVFDTKEESEALVVKGLLDSAGIDAIITTLDAPQDILPGVGGVTVRVSAEDAEAARSLIEDYRNNPLSDDEAVSGGSAA